MKPVQFAAVFTLFLIAGCGQSSQKKNLLVGRWQSQKIIFSNGVERDGDPLDEWVITETEHCYSFNGHKENCNSCTFRDSIIYFFGSKPIYYVEKLTEDELVVHHVTDMNPIRYDDTKEQFRRVP